MVIVYKTLIVNILALFKLMRIISEEDKFENSVDYTLLHRICSDP